MVAGTPNFILYSSQTLHKDPAYMQRTYDGSTTWDDMTDQASQPRVSMWARHSVARCEVPRDVRGRVDAGHVRQRDNDLISRELIHTLLGPSEVVVHREVSCSQMSKLKGRPLYWGRSPGDEIRCGA